MIKKGQPLKLRPGSDVEVIYRLIEAGVSSPSQLHIRSKMPYMKVHRAIWNLSYAGMLDKSKTNGKYRYTVKHKQPRGIETEVWAGVAFIFRVNTDEK